MKVVVTGADGQLGRELVAAFADREAVGLGRDALDVSDREAVASVIGGLRPAVVVNAAAWTDVDGCQADAERAFAVNALGVRWLAEASERCGARLVQISTDYVFDGTKSQPYVEGDEPHPINVYGASKLGGERESGGDALVVRTSWVNGRHGNNVAKTILRLAGSDQALRFVDDQYGHPTFADDLAGGIRRLVDEGRTGLCHLTNQGVVSWYGFAREVLSASGRDPDRVEPISTSDMPRPAPRPANSVLDNAVLRREGEPLLDDFRVPLARLVAVLR